MIPTPYRYRSFHLLTRANCVRLNRLLAWAMLVAPVLQFLISANIMNCLWLDFSLLITHGILSLVLFGVPKVKGEKFNFSMRIFGFRPEKLSPRNSFLLSGYRVAQGLSVYLVFMIASFIPGAYWLTQQMLAMLLVSFMFFPIVRMPFAVLGHIRDATSLAMQRWQWGETEQISKIIMISYALLVAHKLFAG